MPPKKKGASSSARQTVAGASASGEQPEAALQEAFDASAAAAEQPKDPPEPAAKVDAAAPAAAYAAAVVIRGDTTAGHRPDKGATRSLEAGSKGASGAPPRSTSLEDYISVVVTPKLTFQLCRRPEWKEVQDISQDDLRRGFLSRFPPALEHQMSSERLSFRPALPPTSRITEETTSLVFKLVSDEVPDDRVMLTVLRELEKSYESMLRQSVSERSEVLQGQFVFQEEVEEARREQDKQLQALRKENNSLRGQLQSVQKRLFLLEQEKDQLRLEQQHTKDREARLERRLCEMGRVHSAGQEELAQQVEALRGLVEAAAFAAQPELVTAEARQQDAAIAGSGTEELVKPALAPAAAEAAAAEAAAAQAPAASAPAAPAAVEADRRAKSDDIMRRAQVPQRMRWADECSQGTEEEDPAPCSADVECQTDAQLQPATFEGARAEDVAALEQRVGTLQEQLVSLQGWLLQGSALLGAAAAAGPRPTAPQ